MACFTEASYLLVMEEFCDDLDLACKMTKRQATNPILLTHQEAIATVYTVHHVSIRYSLTQTVSTIAFFDESSIEQ